MGVSHQTPGDLVASPGGQRGMTTPDSTNAPIAVVLNRDLLFGSRIRAALKTLGLSPLFVNDTEAFVAALNAHQDTAAIGIIDMNGVVDWAALANAQRCVPTLAFGPHTDAGNRRAAKSAGITRIVSNGQFHSEMAQLIDRYRIS
jgi:hypothetical protein